MATEIDHDLLDRSQLTEAMRNLTAECEIDPELLKLKPEIIAHEAAKLLQLHAEEIGDIENTQILAGRTVYSALLMCRSSGVDVRANDCGKRLLSVLGVPVHVADRMPTNRMGTAPIHRYRPVMRPLPTFNADAPLPGGRIDFPPMEVEDVLKRNPAFAERMAMVEAQIEDREREFDNPYEAAPLMDPRAEAMRQEIKRELEEKAQIDREFQAIVMHLQAAAGTTLAVGLIALSLWWAGAFELPPGG